MYEREVGTFWDTARGHSVDILSELYVHDLAYVLFKSAGLSKMMYMDSAGGHCLL